MAAAGSDLAGYGAAEEIHRSRDTVVLRTTRLADGVPVILKAVASSSADPMARRRLRREYQILRDLDVPGVVRAYGLHSTTLGLTLELEDSGGDRLRPLPRGMPVGDVLVAAASLARIVAAIHARGVVHRDLNPSNIIRHADGGALHVIDFGGATRLLPEASGAPGASVTSATAATAARSNGGRAAPLEGTLGYLSPEQTGRMNRPVDRRTDLYSLGAVFYELLTGRPPFVAVDALELIHAAVAWMPTPLGEVRAGVPSVVAGIVMKLLAKMPEDRYQSAAGLAADLETCSRHWAATGAVPEMTLGASDRGDGFALPDKLYGRDAQRAVLAEAVSRARAGDVVSLAVLGAAGSGKTALVSELRRTLEGGDGHLAVGKFDQLQRTEPYASVLRALRGLVRTILAESEIGVAAWRRRLLDALGPNGALLISAIPDLETILGPQPPALPLPPAAARQRFLRVLVSFIQAFHAPARPLFLFLDDVQWADAASLELIEHLLTERERGRAALVLAWRSGEVDALHPLAAVLARVPSGEDGALRRIELTPLGVEDVTALLVDALGGARAEAAALAALVVEKTQGNPFFVREFLKALHARDQLRFDAATRRWTWQVDEIRRLAITDNVVELLSRRLRELPEAAREVLSLGACIGNGFDLATVAVASWRTRSEAASALWSAVEAGLLLPMHDDEGSDARLPREETDAVGVDGGAGQGFRFVHDRVQQAAYELLAPEERRRVHLGVGRLLLAQLETHVEGAPSAFAVTAQLNLSLDLLHDPSERRRVAELNLLAGRRAAASAAFEAALTYFEAGVSLLDASAWTSAYALALALHLGAGEAALMCPSSRTAIDYVDVALAHAATVFDKIEAQDIRIKHHVSRYETAPAIQRTLEALRWLDVSLPESPTPAQLGAELESTFQRLRTLDLDRLRALPETRDETVVVAARLMLRCGAVAWYGASSLMPLLFTRIVNLSLDHGVSKYSAWGFIGYALLLATRADDVARAERFGTFARELVSRFDAGDLRARVDFIYYGFIQYRSHPIAAVVDAYLPLYHQAIEAGDLEAAGLAAFGYVNRSLLAGVELEEVDERAGRQIEAARRVGQAKIMTTIRLLRQVVANLRGQAKDAGQLDGEHLQPEAYLRMLRDASDKSTEGLYHRFQSVLGFLFGTAEQAVREVLAAEALLANQGAIQSSLFGLYAVLARVTLAQQGAGAGSAELLEKARVDLAVMAKWAVDAPMNFLHHQRLAEAELAAAEGRDGEAASRYDEAISLARSADASHETALALERAARFYLARGRHRSVGPYLAEARAAWTQWGALARLPALDALEAELRRVYVPVVSAAGAEPVTHGALSSGQASRRINDAEIDLASVLKASRAVSGEIVLQALSERLLRVIMENAGARRGLLVLELRQGLSVAARGRIAGAQVEVEVLAPAPLLAAPGAAYPEAVKLLNYVARTRTPLVSDAPGEGRHLLGQLGVDGALPLSVLCVPLVKGQELVGLLYLDNDLAAGAFTESRVELIGMLAAQAALSIQNALLYAELEEHSKNLEQKVEDRTRDLQAKNEELARALEQLRDTQAQLVAQQRLASIGALTAGIAHELKNPLNFVSNFAELSSELATDLTETFAAQRPRLDAAASADIDGILDALRQNTTKINEHGRRAARIIDGMIGHSQASPGRREPSDVAAILAESVHFACQRARARSPGYEVTVRAEYDEGIGPVELSPGDIRRVFINVVDNACYATLKKQAPAGPEYAPIIEVRATSVGDRVEVRIRDNGVGIAPSIADRVYDPFFTTKPTDEGTGLGLYIAHEIVVRGHQGELRFESVEGEFTEVVIDLPR